MTDIIIIKIGGIASKQLTSDFIYQVKEWQDKGKSIIIVHGGGYAINELMASHHIPIEKIDGLRVTSPKAMTLVYHALCETVGPSLCRQLNNHQISTHQITHDMQSIVEADYLNQKKYGQVGEVTAIQSDLLEKDMQSGLIPVLPSIGYTVDGDLLNINADYVATAIAVALQAEKLILMTDVEGVKENGQVLSTLSLPEIDKKIQQEVIVGNMIPKIKGAGQAVSDGVKEVWISSSLTGGTKIIKGESDE